MAFSENRAVMNYWVKKLSETHPSSGATEASSESIVRVVESPGGTRRFVDRPPRRSSRLVHAEHDASCSDSDSEVEEAEATHEATTPQPVSPQYCQLNKASVDYCTKEYNAKMCGTLHHVSVSRARCSHPASSS